MVGNLELVKYKEFFNKIGIDITNSYIDNFSNRKKLQKYQYIMSNIFTDLFTNEEIIHHTWYVHGVYSQKLANIYYKIAEKNEFLTLIKESSSISEDRTREIKDVAKWIRNETSLDSKPETFVLELFSSMIYFKDKFNFNEIFSVVIEMKPHLSEYRNLARKFYDKYPSLFSS